jgi:hypothetical protein
MGRKSGATKGGRTIHPTDALRMFASVVEVVVLCVLALFSCIFLVYTGALGAKGIKKLLFFSLTGKQMRKKEIKKVCVPPRSRSVANHAAGWPLSFAPAGAKAACFQMPISRHASRSRN